VLSKSEGEATPDEDFLTEPLPKPWEQYYSKEWNKYYFHNPQTGETTWDKPQEVSVQSVAVEADGSPGEDASVITPDPHQLGQPVDEKSNANCTPQGNRLHTLSADHSYPHPPSMVIVVVGLVKASWEAYMPQCEPCHALVEQGLLSAVSMKLYMQALVGNRIKKNDLRLSETKRRNAIEPILQAVCDSPVFDAMPDRFQEDCIGLLTMPSVLQKMITRILETVDSSEARGSFKTSPRHIINHKRNICESWCPGFDVKKMEDGSLCRVVMYSIHDKMARYKKEAVDKKRATDELKLSCASLNIRVSTSSKLQKICTDVVISKFDRMVLAMQMHRGRRQALLGICKGYGT
jgi:hypothetical protein